MFWLLFAVLVILTFVVLELITRGGKDWNDWDRRRKIV